MEAVTRFLAKDYNIEYIDPSVYTPPVLEDSLPKTGLMKIQVLETSSGQSTDDQPTKSIYFLTQLFLRGQSILQIWRATYLKVGLIKIHI